MSESGVEALLEQEVYPRIDEDVAFHRAMARAALALLGAAVVEGLASVWTLSALASGRALGLVASGGLLAVAAALLVAAATMARAQRRHHCFDAHAYLAQRLRR